MNFRASVSASIHMFSQPPSPRWTFLGSPSAIDRPTFQAHLWSRARTQIGPPIQHLPHGCGPWEVQKQLGHALSNQYLSIWFYILKHDIVFWCFFFPLTNHLIHPADLSNIHSEFTNRLTHRFSLEWRCLILFFAGNYTRVIKQGSVGSVAFWESSINLVTLWWTNSLQWKDPPFLMGKSTISMAIFNCYVSSPEGIYWMFIVDFRPNASPTEYMIFAHGCFRTNATHGNGLVFFSLYLHGKR